MPYTKVFEQLQQNMQLAYRQAIDADAKLDGLQQSGLGKFTAIFAKDQGFSTESNRFKPYVVELIEEFDALANNEKPNSEAITELVTQLGLLLHTLQNFKQKTKA